MTLNKRRVLFLFAIILSITGIFISVANSADLLISEVQISGDKSTDDYIKIYNNTNDIFNLKDYRLVKRTAAGTTDTTIYAWENSTPLNPRGFYLWTNDNIATSTNADCHSDSIISPSNSIAIRQGAENIGLIIDAVSWGTTSTNSLGTDHHVGNFTSGKKIIFTPNDNPPADQASNIQNQISNSGGGGSTYCQVSKGDVLINEFLSSPGEDEDEWVELISNCSQMVNLENWTLEDGSGTKTTLSGTFDKYFVIDSPKGKLNNAGDAIILKNANGQIIDEIVYGTWQEQVGPKAPGASFSLALDPDTHEFTLCAKPTKGSANIIETQNTEETTTKTVATSSPIIISEILPNPLGADNEGEFIELLNQSSQTVALKDWQLTNAEGQIFIFPNIFINATTAVAFFKTTTGLSLKNDHDTIKLFAPNNKIASQSVSYKNAQEGQSYIYIVDPPSLNHPPVGGEARKTWNWSLVSTPNKTNILIKPNTAPTAIFDSPEQLEINEQIFLDGSDSFDPFSSPLTFAWDFGDQASSTLIASEHAWTKPETFTIKLTVSDGELTSEKVAKIKIIDPNAKPELATISAKNNSQASLTTAQVPPANLTTNTNNSLLKISAIVVTPPGLFGTQWFYAMPLDDTGKATNAVIQIYNNKKEFPALKIGDLIEVQGELYAIKDDNRLKTKAISDITVLEHDNILIEKTVALSEINKNLVNELISVNGKLAKQQGNNIILSDGTKELLIELKPNTKLRVKDFTPDSSYQITGLLKQAGDQLKLWPRYSDDIILLDNKQVLGEKIESTTSAPTATINFVSSKNKEKTLEYLLITALGLIIGLSVLLFKFKKAPTE